MTRPSRSIYCCGGGRCRQRCQRLFRLVATTILPVVIAFFVVAPRAAATYSSSSPAAASERGTNATKEEEGATHRPYEWEDWDHYRILGLDRPTTSSSRPSSSSTSTMTAGDIKQAYRRQARLHHPDKVRQTSTTTPEEANARFARISEAYHVLSDSSSRADYDRSLRLQEFEAAATTQDDGDEYGGWDGDWSWGDSIGGLVTFFEATIRGAADSASRIWHGSIPAADDFDHNDGYHHRHPHTPPPPLTVEQEFVQEWDPILRAMVWRPLSRPRVVLEDEREQDSWQQWEEELWITQQSHTLWPHQVLKAGLGLIRRPFQLHLQSCDLQIVEYNDHDHGHRRTLLWWWSPSSSSSTSSYGGERHRQFHHVGRPWDESSCVLLLRGSQLVLESQWTGRAIWASDVDDDDEADSSGPWWAQPSAPPRYYFARLDGDGSLTVYRFVDDASAPTPRWLMQLARWAFPRSAVVVVPPSASSSPTILFPWQIRCVSSTGPAGCHPVGRLLALARLRLRRLTQRLLGELVRALGQ